jgi:butyryl-CoA dehydrogenase
MDFDLSDEQRLIRATAREFTDKEVVPRARENDRNNHFATEAAQNCSHLAIQVHDGSGYVDDHPVERYYRDVRVTTLYEGTSQIQKLIIGRAETGINALVPA